MKPDFDTTGIEYSKYAAEEPDRAMPGPIRRTPRAEVRRRLVIAATRMFSERGYDDCRVEEIANAAGFTKGAVYSNFASKQGLFGAVLGDGAESEYVAVTAAAQDAEDPITGARRAVRTVAKRIVEDSERGRLGLEFAARAARDEQARAIVTPLRRGQRAAAAESIAAFVDRFGTRSAVNPGTAGLILHCLTNGLSMEHIADPEMINAEVVEEALAVALAALLDLPMDD